MSYKYVTYGAPKRIPFSARNVALKRAMRRLMGFRGTPHEGNGSHELESEDGITWYCPSCKRTTAQIFGVVEDHGK